MTQTPDDTLNAVIHHCALVHRWELQTQEQVTLSYATEARQGWPDGCVIC